MYDGGIPPFKRLTRERVYYASKELVEGCKIGDVIKFDGERYHTDEPKTAKRHELIKELEGKLF